MIVFEKKTAVESTLSLFSQRRQYISLNFGERLLPTTHSGLNVTNCSKISAPRRLVFTQYFCFDRTRYLTFVLCSRVLMLPSLDCGPEINHGTLRPRWTFCEIPSDVRVRIRGKVRETIGPWAISCGFQAGQRVTT